MKVPLVILLIAITPRAFTQTPLWYGGDFDGRGFLESGKNTAIEDARVYDNFLVTGTGFDVDWLFGNFLVDGPLPTQLYYEFRQNVGPGNGGELLYSGTVASTTVLTGRGGFGLLEWEVRGDITHIDLKPGHHWLAVAPVGDGTGHFYLSTTSGANSIGSPIGDGNSFYDSESLGATFDPTSKWLGKGTWDFSLGFGNDNIPEPATLLATLAGLGLLAYRKRRRD
ncbi:MAG: PEP-CTERM sorting domain-containing protein [Fimbriimonadales bacterium]